MSNPLMVKPREKTVVLLPGDYADRLNALAEQVDQLENEAASDKRKKAAALEKAKELDELRDPANIDGAVTVVLREIPGVRWRQLQDDHPPRKSNQRDEIYGYNEDAFHKAAVRACLVEPEVTDEQFDEFVAAVSAANWRKIRDAALELNEREVAIPKSSAVSVLLANRADESKRQRATESA